MPDKLIASLYHGSPREALHHTAGGFCMAQLLISSRPGRNGHYGRALEEAVQGNRNQWPEAWKDKNPLHGNRSFNSMDPRERV